MAQQVIFLGTNPNDGTGEDARDGGAKVNNNFTELYALTSDTINAGAVAYNFSGATKEQRIALAQADGVLLGKSRMFLPASLLPYNITLCPATTSLQRVREGGSYDVADVQAYGAAGDSATDDTAAFTAAIAWAAATSGRVVIPANGTLRYIISDTLQLSSNIMIQGQSAGVGTPIIRFTGGAKTCFNFVGAAESDQLRSALRDFQVEGAGAQTGIGLRLRNFSDCFISGVQFNHFRVGIWADWGQNLYITNDSQLVLNTRGIQVGGDLSQTETPVPAAGIRPGLPTHPFMDQVIIRDVSFSQNEIDINDMGSDRSLGVLEVDGCRFFESSTSPVANKVEFVHVTRRKAFRFTGNFIECPNATRRGIIVSLYDYEAVQQAPSYGFYIGGGNHFLCTNTVSVSAIYIERGSGIIEGNVIEVGDPGATARHIVLAETLLSVRVGLNTYLGYPDNEIDPKILNSGGTIHDVLNSVQKMTKPLTYSASMTVDPYRAELFTVTATNGTAFAFVCTTANKRTGLLTIEITNGSGGALGAATFTGFTLTGGAWTQPANTFRRAISFRYTGLNWIEMSRVGADY